MAKLKVLIIDDANENLNSFKELTSQFEVVKYKPTNRETLLKDLKFAQTDKQHVLNSVNAIYGGWIGFNRCGLVDDEILNLLSPNGNLKIITVCSAGYHLYDLKSLRNFNIDFCNTPTFGADHVSETAIWHILNGFRKFNIFEKLSNERKLVNFDKQDKNNLESSTTEVRNFIENSNLPKGSGKLTLDPSKVPESPETQYAFGHIFGNDKIISPFGRKVTLVGFGAIGKSIAKKLNAFDMKISYVNRSGPIPKDELSSKYDIKFPVTHFSNLQEAVDANFTDLIVLCLPGSPSTQGMINKKDFFDKLNPHSQPPVIVNVGRGTLIDEEDILEALEEGKIRHYGLDVFPEEPRINSKLLNHVNVSITPHLGSSTVENFDKTSDFCLLNIKEKLITGKAQNVQN